MTSRLLTPLVIALVTCIAGALAPLSAAEMMMHGGTFTPAKGEQAGGTVAIVKDGDVTKLILKADFMLSPTPDAKLGFGKDGYIKGTIFSKLTKNDGMQEYILPAGVDLSKYNEVWIWCEQFNVPLAMAKLN